jgi:hypothetical protein
MAEMILKVIGCRYIQEDRFESFYSYLYLYFKLNDEPFKAKIRRDEISWLLVAAGVKNNPYNIFGLTDDWDEIKYEEYFEQEFNENDLRKVIEYLVKTKNTFEIINTKTNMRLQDSKSNMKMYTINLDKEYTFEIYDDRDKVKSENSTIVIYLDKTDEKSVYNKLACEFSSNPKKDIHDNPPLTIALISNVFLILFDDYGGHESYRETYYRGVASRLNEYFKYNKITLIE